MFEASVSASREPAPRDRDGSHPRAESPSLSTTAGPEVPAYELKFLVSEGQAREIEKRAAERMLYDPYGDPRLGNVYHTTTLYFDTDQFHVFHRLGKFKRRKHRLRRYGTASEMFLERKMKWGNRVRKRRSVISEHELHLLVHPMSAVDWPGHWFHRHIIRRELRPVCRIGYRRLALIGQSDDGPIRLTFDRDLQGVAAGDWDVSEVTSGLPILTDQVICELKYRASVPTLFKDVIQSMQLIPSPMSKYRAFLRASGRVTDKEPLDA